MFIAVVDNKTGKQIKPGDNTPVALTPDESQIISTYNVLTPDMKKLFKETLRTWRNVNSEQPNNKKSDTD